METPSPEKYGVTKSHGKVYSHRTSVYKALHGNASLQATYNMFPNNFLLTPSTFAVQCLKLHNFEDRVKRDSFNYNLEHYQKESELTEQLTESRGSMPRAQVPSNLSYFEQNQSNFKHRHQFRNYFNIVHLPLRPSKRIVSCTYHIAK